MPRVAHSYRTVCALTALLIATIFFIVFGVVQQAHAAEILKTNVNASSLKNGADYEIDADVTITIGEEDDKTIGSLRIKNGRSLTIKGTSSGSLTVKKGIDGDSGSSLTIAGGTLNVRREGVTESNCYGINLNAADAKFTMTGGMLNININNTNQSIGDVYGLYTRGFVMSGGSINANVTASPTSNKKVAGINLHYLSSVCNVTGGVISVDAHSKTGNAYGISTDVDTKVKCTFTNVSITTSAVSDVDDCNETCGLFFMNDDYENTFFDCTVISSGKYSGMRSDAKMTINGDSFFELNGTKNWGIDTTHLVLEGESASLNFSTEQGSYGGARVERLTMDGSVFKLADGAQKQGLYIVDSHGQYVNSVDVESKLISHKLTVKTYKRGTSAGYNQDGFFIVSNKTGDATAKGPRVYAMGEHRSIKLTASTNVPGYLFDGWYRTVDGNRISTNPQIEQIMGTEDSSIIAVFKPGNIQVSKLTFTGTVANPVGGEMAKAPSISVAEKGVTVSSVQWVDASTGKAFTGKFQANKQYMLRITAAPKTGYEWASTVTATLNGSKISSQNGSKDIYVKMYTAQSPKTAKPPTGKTLTYNGSEQTGVEAGEGYNLSGTTKATNIGSYTATATLKNGYIWSDGTTAPKEISWKIISGSSPEPGKVPMFRLYNPNSGEHFYTAAQDEHDHLVSLGWNDEGYGWFAPESSSTPVYRLYNSIGGEHHYTMNIDERDWLIGLGWNDEGIGWYSDDKRTVTLYREYNPNAYANNHNYTTDWTEHSYLVSIGWQDEGTAWFGVQG